MLLNDDVVLIIIDKMLVKNAKKDLVRVLAQISSRMRTLCMSALHLTVRRGNFVSPFRMTYRLTTAAFTMVWFTVSKIRTQASFAVSSCSNPGKVRDPASGVHILTCLSVHVLWCSCGMQRALRQRSAAACHESNTLYGRCLASVRHGHLESHSCLSLSSASAA